jgi:ankyrin repeat protein
VSAGANKDYQMQDGRTALFVASKKGHTEIVQYLVSAGANKDHQEQDGWTALLIASQNGQTETVQY